MADTPDTEQPQGPTTLRLKTKGKLTDAGDALGLQRGDVLVALNGVAFEGNARELNNRFDLSGGRPLAMTFARNGVELTVLADHPNLGKWESVPVPGWKGERQDPEALRNWEILRSGDGFYDLHPLTTPQLTLICPPIWLLQQRLWAPAAAICATIAVGGLIWWPIAAVFYVLSGMALRRMATNLFRADRMNMGLYPYAIVAATSESSAHAAYKKIDPMGRFLFAPVETVEDQTAPETTA